ncbi:MAG: xanthine dehydrogenase family protein [Acidimicrobiia bacterium]|nr:xanthine dehydrogenase family protein [Acidimicrobiia bacterium]MYE71767.1 xanthine dehydrogenase family protein [Acidimicrobiia bacterium]MYJ62440.1 xanthine dehydrogenase family protein [Acidimicrobiia bacterium]
MRKLIRSATMRFTGSSVPRREDPRLLAGAGRFVDDINRPDLLEAVFVRSPVAHGRLVSVDPDAALDTEGVVAVLTAEDLAQCCSPMGLGIGGPLIVPAHLPLADEKVRFAGDPVALVIATSRAAAEDGADAVEVDIEPLPPVTCSAAMGENAAAVWDEAPDNVLWSGGEVWGDPDETFASAAHVISETLAQHRHTCVPLEARGGLAEYDPSAGNLRYEVSHQNPHALRVHLSAILGLPATQLRVICDSIGGSFGLKSNPTREDVAVCAAARLLGQPVRWVEDRAENLVAGGHAREEQVSVEAALDENGVVIGLRADLVMDHGAYPFLNLPMSLFANIIKVLLPGTLRVRHYQFRGSVVATNKASFVAYRGPWEIECWVRERLMDLIARQLELDPLEVRRRNYMDDDQFPGAMLTGPTLEFMTINQTLDRAVELADYQGFRTAQAEARAEGRYLGIGLCTYLEPGPGPTDYGQALGFTYEQRSMQRARVKLEPDGSVTLFTSQQPHGQSHETTLSQVVADELGVGINDVRVVCGDTDQVPFNMVSTGGSRAATLGAGAALGAARIVRNKLLSVVANLLEANPDDLEIIDGVVAVRGSPDRSKTVAEVARLSYMAPFTLDEALGDGFDASFDFETPAGGWTQSTHVCWVELDPGTGLVTVPRYLVVEDCGEMINPAVVEGQIRGGVAQGIGSVLLERIIYDDSGQCTTSTFMDYLLPTAAEIPRIDIEHLEGPSQGDVPWRGVGEGGAIGAPAAVCNAIEDALAPWDVAITEQYLPPSRILQFISPAAEPDTAGN